MTAPVAVFSKPIAIPAKIPYIGPSQYPANTISNMLNGVIDPPRGILKSETWFSKKARAIHIAQMASFFGRDIVLDIKKTSLKS
jgi:hypothetical protein